MKLLLHPMWVIWNGAIEPEVLIDPNFTYWSETFRDRLELQRAKSNALELDETNEPIKNNSNENKLL